MKMRHFSSLLIAGGLFAFGLGSASNAQVISEPANVHTVDVSKALRTGRSPGFRVEHFASLASGDRVGFDLPTTGVGARSVARIALEVDRLQTRPGNRRSWSMRATNGGLAHAQFVSIGSIYLQVKNCPVQRELLEELTKLSINCCGAGPS